MEDYPVTGTFEKQLPWDYISRSMLQAGLGFWQLKSDASGQTILQVDDTILHLTGCTKDEFPVYFHDYLKNFIHPDEQKGASEDVSKSIARQPHKFDMEYRLYNKKTGQWRWMHAYGEIDRSAGDGGGQRIAFGCLQDIHDSKTASDRLAASEASLKLGKQRLDMVLDAAGAVVWDWDLTTDQVSYGVEKNDLKHGRNPATANLGLFAGNWDEVLSGEDKKRIQEAKERHFCGDSDYFEVQFQVFNNSGYPIWFQSRGQIVARDEHGAPIRMLGVMLDISQQKAAYLALNESRKQLDQIVKSVDIATWEWDLPSDKLTVNDNYEKMLGMNREAIGTTMTEWGRLVHPGDLQATGHHLENLRNGRTDSTSMEMRLKHQDGHYVWVYGATKVIEQDARGLPLKIVGFQIDFSDRKSMEEARKEALSVISRQKENLEKQLKERAVLLSEIQRQVEKLIADSGSRRDDEQKAIRDEMIRLQAELSGENSSEGSFGRYMSMAFKFISNERVWYKAILDSLPFPTSVFDLGKRWTYLNPQAAETMGGAVADYLGVNYNDAWTDYQDSDEVNVLGSTGKRTFTRYLPSSGFFFSCQSSMLKGEDNLAIGFIETMQDVTDAHEADERIRLMLNATPLACTFFNPDGSLVDCNQEALTLCGVTDKTVYMQRFYEFLTASMPGGKSAKDTFVEGLTEAYIKGHSTFRLILTSADQVKIPGEVYFRRVNWRGRYIILGYCRDLRRLLTAQEEADRERLLMRQILEGCPVCFTITINGVVKYLTPYTSEILGVEAGNSLYSVLVDRTELDAVKEELDQKHEADWRSIRIYLKNGKVSENLIRAYYGEYEGRPAIMTWLVDVTEIKKSERELKIARDLAEESTRVKSYFLANMSHEIRTPMNAIIGLTHLLLQTELNDSQRDYVDKTDMAAKSLLHLINDILDFSKIEAGRMELVEREFEIDEVLTRVVSLAETEVQTKGLEFVLMVQPDVPARLIGDDMRLFQVLNNLISNAVKFTETGEISLSISRAAEGENFLRFTVADTGIGLTVDQAAKLFSPFTQADVSTTRRYGGTGLGLAICKRLVELMGGKIWCQGKPGQGSSFHFTAKFTSHDNQRNYAEKISIFEGRAALVIDDNPHVLNAVKIYLRTFGFIVSTALSGDEAKSKLKKLSAEGKKPDLILIDGFMPEVNGLEALEQIKPIYAPQEVPAVLMTVSQSYHHIMPHLTEEGFKAVLNKPVTVFGLRKVLEQLFGSRAGFGQKAHLEAVPAGGSAADLVKHLKGANVLLVEDNEVNQLVARKIIKKAGLEVTVANNGQEALDILGGGVPFDLILMDIQMPVMDGLTATREIRRNSEFKDLPIVAMTAHAMVQDREKSLEAGMNDHICKPLDIDELFRSLAKWIRPPVLPKP